MSTTTWGSAVSSGSSSVKIGLTISRSSTSDVSTITVKVYCWTKYAVSDSNNTLYYDSGATSATTSRGSVTISTSVSSGSGWSSSNKVLLKTYTHKYDRKTSAYTVNFAAKLTGIDVVGSSSVMKVTASCSVPVLASYTIAYNANSGSGSMSSQTKYYGVNLTLRSNSFTRTGYTFSKYNTASGGGGTSYSSGGTYSANSAATMYAQWTANTYYISFGSNGGSGSMSSMTCKYGTSYTLTSNSFTRTGYTFSKWNTSTGGTGTSYSNGATVKNLTSTSGGTYKLYAIWTGNTYYIAFNANGGSGSMSTMTCTYGTSYTLTTNSFTRTDYAFNGWNTKSGGTGTSYSNKATVKSLTSTSGGTVTLYAQWVSTYTAPVISNIKLTRCDSDGTANDDGVYCKATFKYTTYSSDYPAQTIYVAVGSSNTSDTVSSASATVSYIVGGSLDAETSYTVTIKVTDTYPTTTTATSTLGVAAYPIDIYKDGTGVAIGGVAVANILKIFKAMTVTGNNCITVVNDGTDSTDTYTIYSRTDTGVKIGTGIGSGGYNRGIYDHYEGKWMIYKNSSNHTYVNGATTIPSTLAVTGAITGSSTLTTSGVIYDNGGFYASKSNINGYFRLVDSTNLHGINAGYYEDENRVYISHVDYTDSSSYAVDNWYSALCLNEASVKVTYPLIVPASNNYGSLRDSNGVSLIGTSSSSNIYIGNDDSSYCTGNTNIYSSTGSIKLNSTSVVMLGSYSTDYSAKLRFGCSYSQEAGISAYFSDGEAHNIAYRAASSNYCYYGYYSSSLTTRAYIRGTAVYYTNSSGSTSLSDENLKEDIEEYSDDYDTFFDSLIPRTFKYIQGQSGRVHAGFITQEVEDALETAGLTTQEFAGVNIHSVEREQEEVEVQIGTETIEVEDDESDEVTITERPIYEKVMVDLDDSAANYLLDQGIDEEHDLIYTEFISLNTWQIQKLKSRVSDLETENDKLKATIEAQQATIDAILEKIGGIE